MKTVDDLMKPRYKVIADYPNSPFEVGKILKLSKQNDARPFTYMWWEDRNQGHTLYESELKDYPHLFKKLEWWEAREIDDMPEYLKIVGDVYTQWKLVFIKENSIIKIKFWDVNLPYLDKNDWVIVTHTLPATESEYTTYISQTKP